MPVKPGLATLLVGDDPASAICVGSRRRICVDLGIRDLRRHLSILGADDLPATYLGCIRAYRRAWWSCSTRELSPFGQPEWDGQMRTRLKRSKSKIGRQKREAPH